MVQIHPSPLYLACARDCSVAYTNMGPPGVCMQSLHPADLGGGASLPSNGCGAPGPEGEWKGPARHHVL